jgi:hypothetical protein
MIIADKAQGKIGSLVEFGLASGVRGDSAGRDY